MPCYFVSNGTTSSSSGMRERRNKRVDCNFCTTALFILLLDKVIVCSYADAHTFVSLCSSHALFSLYTLHDLFKLTVASNGCHLQMDNGHSRAEHNLCCLGYTIELELVLRTCCGGKEVGFHEIRHEVLLIFAVLANVPVVDVSAKRFAVKNLRSPETSILAFVGAVPFRFLYSLLPHLHLPLAKCLFVLCSLEPLKAPEGSRDILEHLFRVALGVDVLEVLLGFLEWHFLCHQLLKSWLIHTQKLQALAGCYDCRSHPRISTKPLHILDELDDVDWAEKWEWACRSQQHTLHSHHCFVCPLYRQCRGVQHHIHPHLHRRARLLLHQLEDFDDDVLAVLPSIPPKMVCKEGETKDFFFISSYIAS